MVGIGEGMGLAPTLAETYDPQSRLHVAQGTYPTEDAVAYELNCLAKQLTRRGIQVLRPESIGINQVFTRDIGLVIDREFIMTHLVEDRCERTKGLRIHAQSESRGPHSSACFRSNGRRGHHAHGR